MYNTEQKIAKWEILKKIILEFIPENYTINVKGLDDDSEYFHPVINIENDVVITGQSDVNHSDDNVYAWTLRTHQDIGVYTKVIEFNIDGLEQIKKILEDWQDYRIKIMQYIDMCKIINQNIEMLQEIKGNIQGNLLCDTFLKEDRDKCLKNLFVVKEWIENERLIDRCSGLK